jgi:hypothetical protein
MEYTSIATLTFLSACIISLFLLTFLYKPYKSYVDKINVSNPDEITRKTYPLPVGGTGTLVAPTTLDYSFFDNSFVRIVPVTGTTSSAESFITLPSVATFVSQLGLQDGDTRYFELYNKTTQNVTMVTLAGQGWQPLSQVGGQNTIPSLFNFGYGFTIIDSANNIGRVFYATGGLA